MFWLHFCPFPFNARSVRQCKKRHIVPPLAVLCNVTNGLFCKILVPSLWRLRSKNNMRVKVKDRHLIYEMESEMAKDNTKVYRVADE